MNRLKKMSRSSWWIGILLVLNIITITLLWLGRPDHMMPPPQNMGRFITNELGLSEEQAVQFKELQDQHRQQNQVAQSMARELRRALFQELAKSSPDTTRIQDLQNQLARQQAARNETLAAHFLELKAICTPEQQEKLGTIFLRALRPPPPPGGRLGRPPRE